MAELGETDDPRALIPGSVESVSTAAEEMRSRARLMEDVATNLADVRIDDWDGPASSAFWEQFTPEAGNWRLGRDAMTSAAEALDGHASALHWAQGQAAEAIALWEQGQQATRQAMQSPVSPFGGDPFGAMPLGTMPLGTMPLGTEPLGGQPFGPGATDPGAALRQQAVDVLERAREQLRTSGDTSASAIDDVGGKGDGAPSWLRGPAQFVDKNGVQPKLGVDLARSEGWLERAERQQAEGDRFARFGQWGNEFDRRQGPGFNATLVGDKVEGSLLGTEARGATQVGDLTLGGQADAKAFGGEASAGAGFTQDGLNAQAKVNGYVAQVGVDGSAVLGPAEVSGSANGFVGAEAGAHGAVGLDGVHVGADAFAGAKATGAVHGDLGGLGVGATGEAWAGIGAEANAQLGQGPDGKWTIGAEAGAGLGFGGKIGFEVTVDPSQITDTVSDAASALNPFD